MTNREAIEYASKNSFIDLYNKGGIDKLKELKAEFVESDIITFSQTIDFISDKIAFLEGEEVERFTKAAGKGEIDGNEME